MPKQINLLPTDLSKKSPLGKLQRNIKQITTVATSIFIVILIFVGVYLLILSSQITRSKSNQESLKASLAALEQTEQGIILVKDRLKNISSVLALSTANKGVENLNILNSAIPNGAILSEADILTEKTEVTYQVQLSSDLVGLIETISSTDFYKKILLKSFSYNPKTGYLVSLELFF